MIYNEELIEEVWGRSQEAWEAFRSNACQMPGYNGEFLRDAFIAGMVTAIVVMGNRELDKMEGAK